MSLDYMTTSIRHCFSIGMCVTLANSKVLFRLLDNTGSEVFKVTAEGRVTTNRLNLADLPTSAAGLAAGDVWNDGGTLKIK